jgi:ATP:corrinoid adenosyltransferase
MTDATKHEAEMKALQKEMRGKMAAARRRKGLIEHPFKQGIRAQPGIEF